MLDALIVLGETKLFETPFNLRHCEAVTVVEYSAKALIIVTVVFEPLAPSISM